MSRKNLPERTDLEIFATRKPKLSLFVMECNANRWRVKSTLYHLNNYVHIVDASSDKVRSNITATRTCTKCNTRCKKGSYFKLDDKTYYTCIGSGHYFEDLSEIEWDTLKELITFEYNVIMESLL